MGSKNFSYPKKWHPFWLCQRKVAFLREFPALAFSDEKSVPLLQDFAGHHPAGRHDVRGVSALLASGRRLAP